MDIKNLGQIVSMTTCPYCNFNTQIYPNQNVAICEHCKSEIDVEFEKFSRNKAERENKSL